MTDMKLMTGFPAVAGKNAEILILGTMPGAESLRKKQYYGHPRNAFWPIMGRLLGKDAEKLTYAGKKRMLVSARIALWDVIAACRRKGSLDTAMIPASVKVNELAGFFRAHPGVKRVFFNGGHAEKEYNKRVLNGLPTALHLKYTRLPSTSPAMARLTRERKLAAWAAILDHVSRGHTAVRPGRKPSCRRIPSLIGRIK